MKHDQSKPIRLLLSALGVAVVLCSPVASAQDTTTVVLVPLKDNSIYEEGEKSSGAGDRLFAGRASISVVGAARRALLAFDMAGNIPAGSTVQSATLTMQVTNAPSSAPPPTPIGLHRLSKDWGEAGSDAGFLGGQGAPAQAGDATWTQNLFGSENWTTAGGDFVVGSSATTTVGLATTSADWTGAQLTADAQDFLDNPAANFGWIVIGNEGAITTARGFGSRENTDPAKRPKLTIEYVPPVQQTNFEAWVALFNVPEPVDFGADLDGDGLITTFEYGAGLDPTTKNAISEAYSFVVDANDPNNRLVAKFVRDPRADDMTYRMEASFDLENWFTLAESIGGAAPTGPGLVSDLPIAGRDPFREVTVKHTPDFDGKPEAFVRMVVILDQP